MTYGRKICQETAEKCEINLKKVLTKFRWLSLKKFKKIWEKSAKNYDDMNAENIWGKGQKNSETCKKIRRKFQWNKEEFKKKLRYRY